MMLRLQTFGGLALTNGLAERPQPRRRLALLARLAMAGARGVSRDELLALFWPERDLESARHSLDQLLYETRRAFGTSPTSGTSTLRLEADVIASDVAEWNSALERNDLEAAVALYRGPLLHGFYLNGSLEFERWVDDARARIAAEYRGALEALATRAMSRGDRADTVRWRRRLAMEDRLSSRTALGLMRALVDAGDRAGALEFARLHERIVRAELETPPDPAVAEFVESLRTESNQVATQPATIDSASASLAPVAPEIAVISDAATDSIADAPRRPGVARRRMTRSVVTVATLAVVALAYVIARQRDSQSIRSSSFTTPHSAGTTRRATSPPRMARARYETTNIAVHELFERGRDPSLTRSDSGVRRAISYLQQAVNLDTNYAPAYALLASRYATATWGTTLSIAERRVMLARARAVARRAVALDDSLAEAHVELGYVLGVSYDEAASLAELERATALDPGNEMSQEMLVKAYEWTGRPADAVIAAQRAVSIDPLSPTAHAELGDAFYFAHRYGDALRELAKVAGVQPPLRRAPGYIAAVYAATGRWSDAIATLRPFVDHEPHTRGLFGYALARSGRREEATRVLAQMLVDESAGRAPAAGIAEVYAGLGDYDRAFVWLERALDDHSLRPEFMGPVFDELRADARFQPIKDRLGLARR